MKAKVGAVLFKPLSESERERLEILIEASATVIQASSKLLRYCRHDKYDLEKALCKMGTAVERMTMAGDIYRTESNANAKIYPFVPERQSSQRS